MIKQIIKITLSLLFIAASFSSCVDDKDFDTPQVKEVDLENIIQANVLSISDVQNAIATNFPANPDVSDLVHTWKSVSTQEPIVVKKWMVGYVVSNDLTGNFYKKLILQDKLENPTAGIEIRIDQSGLHSTYNVGRKVYVILNGLSVGYYDGKQGSAPGYVNQSVPNDGTPGVYKLGIKGEDFAVDRIPGNEYKNYVLRTSISETIVPKVITTNDFNDATMNTAVQMDNMQFTLDEILANATYAAEDGDAYDASRFLISCDTEATFGLMTSTFANFNELHVPHGVGTLTGVLVKNFRENDPVVVLNSHEDINFTGSDRCDPIILDCGLASVEGTTDLLIENFDGGAIPSTWTNYIQEGSRDWNPFNGGSAFFGYSVRMGSYQSNDASSIAWLISPSINMDSQSGETLEFKTSNSFADGSKLELMFSNDWDGTESGIATATWGLLTAATIVDDGEYYQNWVSSGIVDLSCAEGSNFHIAFKYTGSGNSGFDGTYELDDIKIKF